MWSLVHAGEVTYETHIGSLNCTDLSPQISRIEIPDTCLEEVIPANKELDDDFVAYDGSSEYEIFSCVTKSAAVSLFTALQTLISSCGAVLVCIVLVMYQY